jgi:elongation factor 1-gamma
MALDAYKRLYSNTPAAQFKEVAVKGLWEGAAIPNSPTQEVFPGFDPAGFSLWFCDYKYTDENTVNYVVMNKVGGFLQRIDYARKYAFGVMCILKDGDTFPIRGFWIFRGGAIPPQMVEECYDLDLYTWTKLDWPLDDKTKARIGDMLAEEATIDGLEHVECKVFVRLCFVFLVVFRRGCFGGTVVGGGLSLCLSLTHTHSHVHTTHTHTHRNELPTRVRVGWGGGRRV